MRMKKLLAIALAAAALAGLAACQSSITDDATVYVQGVLDSTYLGQAVSRPYHEEN